MKKANPSPHVQLTRMCSGKRVEITTTHIEHSQICIHYFHWNSTRGFGAVSNLAPRSTSPAPNLPLQIDDVGEVVSNDHAFYLSLKLLWQLWSEALWSVVVYISIFLPKKICPLLKCIICSPSFCSKFIFLGNKGSELHLQANEKEKYFFI